MPSDQRCLCADLPEEAHIPMGGDDLDQHFFATVERVKDHGGWQWWLYLARCSACAQDWLVAQEERIFDEYFLIKLGPDVAGLIESRGMWPEPFQTYEDVLTRGAKVARHCVFFDDLAASLVWSAQDLRAERPNITEPEIARLLGLELAQARRVIAEADKRN